MGLFKNMKDTMAGAAELTKTGKEMQKEQGGGGGMFGMAGMAQSVQNANEALKSVQEQQATQVRLLSEGLVGQGTIKALRDTGTQVNYQPQFEIDLEIALPDRDPYPVTITQVVAMSVLPQFQPGVTMPVHVDPKDPNIVMIG
jgi:hypothetical protein